MLSAPAYLVEPLATNSWPDRSWQARGIWKHMSAVEIRGAFLDDDAGAAGPGFYRRDTREFKHALPAILQGSLYNCDLWR